MSEENLKELLVLAKKAMTIISVEGRNKEFVYDLRDLIRKIEAERADVRDQ